MIPEIGQFALILSLCMALIQAVFPIAGYFRGIPEWMAMARPAARAQFGFLVIAYGCLTYAFITNDYSLVYAANNSNSQLPLIYKISGVWGAHEGSLLLWVLILSVWTLAITIFSKTLPDDFVARVLGVMGLISIGFLLFIIATSNPFDRLLPAALEGKDLNPLLQDFGLAIHPPMLYMGYVGFSVAFSFAIAALLGGKLDAAWARWSRPWTTVSWVFLTLGIMLGSWWAYYELGWGGWWFWDPVENASFMPWLVGTALIHSLAVTEKRGTLRAWTVLLALCAFALSLLGTFLVRSGVLTSVHAFATDPTRGVYILAFLVIVIGSSLLLYAWRVPKIKSTASFQFLSRETGLLINNVLLVVAAASILLGTLYPLFLDALGLGKISVGPPYFEAVFTPIMLVLLLVMGVGPIIRWKKDQSISLLKRVKVSLILAGIAAAIFILYPSKEFPALLVVCLTIAIWVVASTLNTIWQRISGKENKFVAFIRLPLGFHGMSLAHIGIAVFAIGAGMASTFSIEKDIRMVPGDDYEMNEYRIHLDEVRQVSGPNYQASEGIIRLFKNDKEIAVLKPQKRIYNVRGMSMTEAGIDAGFFRDIYVALGEPLGDGAWSMRVYYKPFIRWIWLGPILMGLGGLLAASDRRYRLASKRVTDKSATNKATQTIPSELQPGNV